MTISSLRSGLAAGLAVLTVSACADAVDALTSHSRPVASVAGETLGVRELATMLAESPMPDSALSARWAAQTARLWADYVLLIRAFQEPDSTESLDFDPLLEAGRYYPAVAVRQYEADVILGGIEPTDEEVREHFDREQPLTRLDIRRIRLNIPVGSSRAEIDSLQAKARELHAQAVGGADFVEIARQHSDEPAVARGQVVAYQGHDDFSPQADSVVFNLRPGEISPVFETESEIVFYRIERRRVPDFDTVSDMVRRRMVDERQTSRISAAADSLLFNSRRSVADGAGRVARSIAADPDLGEGRIAGSLRLVRYEGGELTVAELRALFRARPDLRRRFTGHEEDEQIEIDLYELAGDEILIKAARDSGIELPEAARTEMREGIARQMSAIAGRFQISHALAVSPAFDVAVESRRFVVQVLRRSNPIPWLGEFRLILDPVYPSRVDERSAESAARIARELRGLHEDAGTEESGVDELMAPANGDETEEAGH